MKKVYIKDSLTGAVSFIIGIYISSTIVWEWFFSLPIDLTAAGILGAILGPFLFKERRKQREKEGVK